MPAQVESLVIKPDAEEREWSEGIETVEPSSPSHSCSSSGMSSPTTSSSPTLSSSSETSPALSTASSRSRARRPYRMASNFELSDEQPEHVEIKKGRDKGDSYAALFGPPPPRFPKNARRSVSAAPTTIQQRRSKKPLPLNPLTGERLGSQQGLDIPPQETPCTLVPNFSRFKRPPPGGFSTQLW